MGLAVLRQLVLSECGLIENSEQCFDVDSHNPLRLQCGTLVQNASMARRAVASHTVVLWMQEERQPITSGLRQSSYEHALWFNSSNGWWIRASFPVVVRSQNPVVRRSRSNCRASGCRVKVEVVEKRLIRPPLLNRLIHQQRIGADIAIGSARLSGRGSVSIFNIIVLCDLYRGIVDVEQARRQGAIQVVSQKDIVREDKWRRAAHPVLIIVAGPAAQQDDRIDVIDERIIRK